MQLKNIIRIYREGWWLILRCLVFVIALWISLLPLKLLEAFEDEISGTANNTILVIYVLVYFPFAVYFAYHMVKDIHKKDHPFVPLVERVRRKKPPADK